MKYEFSQLVDINELKEVFESLYSIMGISMALNDVNGNILFRIGWSEVCNKFHRKSNITKKRCIESNKNIINRIRDNKLYVVSKCKNGLIDVAMPIMINGCHMANIKMGQFFLEEPDIMKFKKQAQEIGFNQREYLKAIMKIPVISKEKLEKCISVLVQLAKFSAQLGYEKIKYLEEKQKANNNLEELAAVYEQLYASEEELRVQYDELHNSQRLLKISEERYRLVLDATDDGIYDLNINKDELYYSPKAKKMLGITSNKNCNYETWEKSIHLEDRNRVINALNKYLKSEIDTFNVEYRLLNKDDSYLWIRDKAIIIYDQNNEPVRMVGAYINIHEQKKWEEAIIKIAHYDTLTGLLSRKIFINMLTEELVKCKQGTIFFIDLDNFKKINDTLGHEAGDELLKNVSEKLKEFISDDIEICRFGGDEFLILHRNIYNYRDAENFIKNIINEVFKKHWIIKNTLFYITASIGITTYPKDGISVNEILKNADTAMYKAKALGKNKYEFFNRNMYIEILQKTQKENDLTNALKNNEFIIQYQPQIETETRKILGFEALLRWKHSEKGFIPPNEFIPLAEETGLIVDIGEWVFKKVCEQNKKWKDEGYDYKYISVNISSIQLQQDNFLNTINKIIKETDIDPKFIQLEITESVLMQNIEENVKKLERLIKLGMDVAMDDFGTGYSSLNYLRKIPINTLKIDKSFIDNIYENSVEGNIIEGIVILAHKMHLDVVAEGVETEEQLKILQEKNCDKVQGYFFSKPLYIEEAEKLLKKGFEK
ncbi:EAL domain-containing protein [Haloimpatiens sp. FM7330]|uniref:EAL domain-containing protein n=1 Tax=Haloimpatiens sp. FM7330 TaxID=3298610 RepID=UPI00362782F6